MATFYGIESSKPNASIPQLESQGVLGGVVKASYDKYTSAGAIAINSIIKMGKLPFGARVVGYWLKSEDLGTAGTMELGHSASVEVDTAGSPLVAASASAFLAGIVVSAAITADHANASAALAGLGKSFGGSVDIELKASVATTLAGSIETCVYYVID